MIRRLLAVAPAVVLVGCSPATVQGAGHAETVRSTPVATRVAASPTATGLVVPTVEPSAVRTVTQRTAAPRRTVQPAPMDGCNRNYTPCVPNDPIDVDCAGGSGNGPSYVTGPVYVIGEDVYGLDADGNGIGCEVGAPHSQAAAPQAPPAADEAPFTDPPPTTAPAPTTKPTKPPKTTQSASGAPAAADPFRVSP